MVAGWWSGFLSTQAVVVRPADSVHILVQGFQ